MYNSVEDFNSKIKSVMITEEEIKEIFQMRKQGMLQREIADKIGCTRSNISYILSNKTWQV